MADELVSIIIPTYNGEKRIAKTLSSIINQDYPNLEIIVVDDVSSDNTLSIARSILNDSGRPFKLIKRTKNGGQCAARNTGFESASGKYVIFFDHDDLAEKNFVSLLCREAEDKNADLVFCSTKHYYEDGNRYEDESIIDINADLSPEKYLEAWADRKILFWSVWNFIFNRQFLINNSLRFTEGCKLGEDTELVLKALACASRVSFVKDMLYIYVHHGNQTSNRHKELTMFHAVITSRLRSGRFIARHTKSRKAKNYALNFYIPDTIVKQFTVCAKDGSREHYLRLIRALKHKKIRRLLLSSARYIITKPELFFKSIALIYAPGLYYSLRRGHHEG